MPIHVTVTALVIFSLLSVVVAIMRSNRDTRLGLLTLAGLVSFGLFVVLNVLDWPGAVLSTFWVDHAIIAATVSTLPLAGVGFFTFRLYDARKQETLDTKVVAIARSGLVDHLVDIDVALSLLTWSTEQVRDRWPDSRVSGRPLRWLRADRHLLGAGRTETDPRLMAVEAIGETAGPDGRDDLLDQATRRLMAGVKEWGPLLSRSRSGGEDLVRLGDLRHDLLSLRHRDAVESGLVRQVQATCRQLAHDFECASHRKGEHHHRPELISVLAGAAAPLVVHQD